MAYNYVMNVVEKVYLEFFNNLKYFKQEDIRFSQAIRLGAIEDALNSFCPELIPTIGCRVVFANKTTGAKTFVLVDLDFNPNSPNAMNGNEFMVFFRFYEDGSFEQKFYTSEKSFKDLNLMLLHPAPDIRRPQWKQLEFIIADHLGII